MDQTTTSPLYRTLLSQNAEQQDHVIKALNHAKATARELSLQEKAAASLVRKTLRSDALWVPHWLTWKTASQVLDTTLEVITGLDATLCRLKCARRTLISLLHPERGIAYTLEKQFHPDPFGAPADAQEEE